MPGEQGFEEEKLPKQEEWDQPADTTPFEKSPAFNGEPAEPEYDVVAEESKTAPLPMPAQETEGTFEVPGTKLSKTAVNPTCHVEISDPQI